MNTDDQETETDPDAAVDEAVAEADRIEEWEWKREDDVLRLCENNKALGRWEGAIFATGVCLALVFIGWLIAQ